MSKKITSPIELSALRDKALANIQLRFPHRDMEVTVHMGTCGIAAGARDVLASLMDELDRTGLERTVTLRQAGCGGLCEREPMCTVRDKEKNMFRYGPLDKESASRIVREHLMGGKPVNEILITE